MERGKLICEASAGALVFEYSIRDFFEAQIAGAYELLVWEHYDAFSGRWASMPGLAGWG
jgi:hypothetical protein